MQMAKEEFEKMVELFNANYKNENGIYGKYCDDFALFSEGWKSAREWTLTEKANKEIK
jgi:hypothetical protein